jgi:dipeptidyl aminopeptidase/acylaminoacyl peptidase
MAVSGWGEEAIENSVVEKICYLSDGLKVKGYFAYPADHKEKKFPCVIWNRGGYKNKGAIDHFTARGIFGQIASWGYIVFTSQYRGNDGGEGTEEIGGADIKDVINLKPLAGEIDFADSSKWGMIGWSRGGMMTLLTLLKDKDFKCAAVTGAISNMQEYIAGNNYLTGFYKQELGEDKFNEEVIKRTVINSVNNLPRIPYLVMHGGNDEAVPVSQSIELARKLQEFNHLYRLVIFEEGDHYLKSHRKEVEAMTQMWLKKYL